MNYYNTSSNSQLRIIKDWIEHERLIVACDFDSTLCPYHKYEGDHCDEMCELIKELKDIGCYIILFTANKYPNKCLQWCTLKGVPIDNLNDNAPEALDYFLKQGYDHPPRKIFYNVLIDDKCGQSQTYNELKTLIYLVKNNLIQKKVYEAETII